MFDMRGGKDLKYSSELPSWARYVHYVLIAFLALIGLAISAFGIYMLVSEDDWFFSLIMIGLGIFVGWMSWGLIGITRFQYEVVMQVELREDGFFTSIQNRKNGEVREELVPFSSMKEVLIARTARKVLTPRNVRSYYILCAQIIMVWTDENGERRYSTFGEEKQENLDSWIARFKQNEVPVYSTQLNLNLIDHPKLVEAYEQIPKIFQDEKAPRFQIGVRVYDTMPEWKSQEMLAREAEKRKRNDVRFFRPIFIGVIAVNFLIALLWMPGWRIEDEMFSDVSPSTELMMINIGFLFLSKAYWRPHVPWYRPLLDTLVIMVAHLFGVTASLLNAPLQAYMFDAVIVENLTLGFFLLCVHGISRLVVYRIIR